MNIIKKIKFIYRNLPKFARQQYFLTKKKNKNISNDGLFPASSFQTRFYYMENMTENNSSINVQLVLSYTGDLNEEIFKSAVDMIVQNNEILRATFNETSNGLQQVVHEDFKPIVNVHDLRGKLSLVDYDNFLND